MTILDRYWPSLANIEQCIRTEAETVDDAVLLAVHEPGPLRVRAANASAEETRTERDLLEALLRPADEGSAVVVAITGASGVGKSHMVRWLHAQLRRHPMRERLVIVLVPKTASLRQVVERILEPLRGRAYEKLKADLSRAIETLSPQDASHLLATALAIELERKSKEGMDALREHGNTADRRARERIAHASGLRDMLRDGTVFDRWFGPVLLRIVRQAIEGGSEAETGELRRFTPADLEVPDDWDTQLATRAANHYLQRLQSNDGAARPVAADVLQDVLDPALRTVFRFSEALGQRTIEEIVDDIRRNLLAEGKELVLLIEDFAALAGIQQPLLTLMIAESDHGGIRVRAPLRTALAVTDGFLPSRQTILTRAKMEWIIPNTAASEEEIIARLTELAGRYLNAARWGVDALREQYAASADENLYGWVRPFQDSLSAEDADLVSAFGTSQHGYPLFPLNAQAMAALCRRELRSGTQLVFNPRAFINAVLRDTLLKRPLHEAGAFPPARFKEAVLSSGVEMGLRAQALSAPVKERLAPVLAYWAGNPTDLASPPSVGRGVFKAFGLPWPYSRAATPVPGSTPPRPPTPQPTTPRPLPQTLPTTTEVGTAGFSALIEAWAQGSLAQRLANQVRQLISSALNERIDWNALRMRAVPINAGQVWLPYAPVGNPTTDPKFVTFEEVRPVPVMLRAGVIALDRWQARGRSWDYPGAEGDYAMVQPLLDRLESQVIAWFARSAQRQAAVAARILHRQALMLGLCQRPHPVSPPLAEYFATMNAAPAQPDPSDRSPVALVAASRARAEAARPQVQRVLLDAVGCFQGTGNQLHAVDPQRLRAAWKAEEADDGPQQIRPEFREAREAAQELGKARLNTLLDRYRAAFDTAAPAVRRLVGAHADADVVTPVRELIALARKASLFPGSDFSTAQLDKSLELLASSGAMALRRRVLTFSEPDAAQSLEFRLAAWAAVDVQLLAEVANCLALADRLVTAIHREAKAALEASGAVDVATTVARLQESLLNVGAVNP